MTSQGHFCRVGTLLASFLFMSGCASQSVMIRPDQLPGVAAWAAEKPWPKQPGTFVDAWGHEVELRGELEEVVIERRDMPGIKELYEAPVIAKIRGNTMFVEGKEYNQVYLPHQISSVEVNTSDKYRSRRVAGGVLLGVGGTFLVGGAVAAVGFASMGGLAGPILSVLVGAPVGGLGVIGVTTGSILLAKGSPPRPDNKNQATAAPRLRVGPGSAELSWTF